VDGGRKKPAAERSVGFLSFEGREHVMKLLSTILGIGGVVSLVIAIILKLADGTLIAGPGGWWRLTVALVLLSIALEVVKPFGKGESAS